MTIKTQGDKEHYENIDGVSWEQIRQYFNLNFGGRWRKSWSEIALKESDIRVSLAYLVMGVIVMIKVETGHNLRCYRKMKLDTHSTRFIFVN